MKILFNKQFLNHNINSRYEGSYRLSGFLEQSVETELNGEPFLPLVHTSEYIDYIRGQCNSEAMLAEVKLSPSTYEAACQAVGLSVKASEQEDFAVVRPPGHHAGRSQTSGFCLFNNMAIAAQRLVNEGKKVFILDIDGHHGDGTQDIFYDSGKVLYCSIHEMNTFPFTGLIYEIGKKEGQGRTLNIPVPEGSGDKEFLKALDKCLRAGRNFQPDIVGVSAGFDGYEGDRLLNLNYSLKAFYECGYRIRKCFPHVFGVLEGGYHEDLKLCVEKFVEGVNIASRPPRITWDENMAIG